MKDQFIRNIGTITKQGQTKLLASTVAIAGCGGLGGFVSEFLVRAGIGHIIAFDADVFSESNLNRQILCTSETIGQSKVKAARKRAMSINPDIVFDAYEEFIDAGTALEKFGNCDLIIDCLDNPKSRIALESIADRLNVKIVHGAIEKENLQVSVIEPMSGVLSMLYAGKSDAPNSGTLSFVPAICAGMQSEIAIKILTGKDPKISGKLLISNLNDFEFDIIDLGK